MDLTRPVEGGLLREILEDAIWAPTHGLTQPWRFQVFTDGGRERLASGLTQLYDQLTPQAARRPEKRAKLHASALEAPVAIAVAACAEPGGKITELDELAATCCAVENLLLSAHQRGLGSFWSTAPVTVSAAFVAWLGLGPHHRGLGLVYLGYPRDGDSPQSQRLPLADRVVFHTR